MTATSSQPLQPRDGVLLPVNVAGKIAKKGEARPDPRTVAKKHPAWPRTWPPKDGWYSVATTWREILDAARSVGQDPFVLRGRYPLLVNRELMARTFPLMAYLHHDATATPVSLRPSPVYEPGAEASAKAALAYRLGMTMTEWVARYLVSLPPTKHFEHGPPPVGAGPDWSRPNAPRPDLWIETASTSPSLWVMEAKGRRHLNQESLRKGAAQLRVLKGRVLNVPHYRVLVGTSVERQVFCIVRHEMHDPTRRLGGVRPPDDSTPDPEGFDPYDLARRELLTYQFLAAQPRARHRILRVTDVGQRPRLRERDPGLAQIRAESRTEAEVFLDNLGRPRAPEGSVDMLTSEVPGTGITLGLSMRLFRACQALEGALLRASIRTSEERAFRDFQAYAAGDIDPSQGWPASPLFTSFITATERTAASNREEIEELYWSDRTRPSPDLAREAPRAYDATDLELYTSDTYLSLNPAVFAE